MSINVNPYSLWEVIVAATNADASVYQTPIGLMKDQIFDVTPVHDTDLQRDSGRVTSPLSVATHATLSIQAGGMPFQALVMMTAMNTKTSEKTVSIRRKAGKNRPLWGAIGVAPTEDDRIIAFGLYKCQLTADPQYTLDGNSNAWLTTTMAGVAVCKESVNEFDHIKIFDTLEDWEAVKPETGSDFLNFFNS